MIDKVVNFSRRPLTVIGFWPIIYYDLESPWVYFVRFHNWFMYSCVTFVVLGQLMYPILNGVNLLEVADYMSDCFGASMVVLKFTIILWGRRDLYRLLKSANVVRSKMVVKETDPELKLLEIKGQREASVVTVIMLILIASTIVPYNLKFLYEYMTQESTYTLPYKGFDYPFEWRKPIIYEILFIIQFIAGINFISIFCAVPSLVAALSIFVCCQFKILQLGLKQLNEIKETEKNLHVKYLKRCIVHHQAIYRFCVHLESIFSPCIFVQFVLSGMTLSLVAFQLTIKNVEIDVKFTYMQFFFLIVGSLFVYCFYGEKISKESKSIGDSVYNTDWYNKTKDFKYLLQQMIFRSQKPVYITACGFINATLESYTAVLKTSVSYFALLRTLGSGDDVQE